MSRRTPCIPFRSSHRGWRPRAVAAALFAGVAACTGPAPAATPTAHPGTSTSAPGFVLRQFTAELPATAAGAAGAASCELVTTASAWREIRARLGGAVAALPDAWCMFAVERALVVVMPGPCAAPVAHEHHVEEDVDVLVLAPAVAGEVVSPAAALVHVVVVPAHEADLAVVLRAAAGAEAGVERTLAVFHRP